ncbi:hypothetical protein AMTRI_Chr05g70360 [Amborella trichopoda]
MALLKTKGKIGERLKRVFKTAVFLVSLFASLLVFSAPTVVAIADALVPCALLSAFTRAGSWHSVKDQWQGYGFRTSLLDVPILSLARSFPIICVYSLCDVRGLSQGPYLGTATICSLFSVALLSVKACLFIGSAETELGAMATLAAQKLHLKQSWGMPVLFLSSLVLALGHVVVAYRISRKARRMLLFHHVDPEAVLTCKHVFSGYQKVPRSPTPGTGKGSRSDNVTKSGASRMGVATANEGMLPIRLLADVDSFFMPCRGLILHYKFSHPSAAAAKSASPFVTRSLSSSENGRFFCTTPGRLKTERPVFVTPNSHHLKRSLSNYFNSSSLYAPLLSDSDACADHIPALKLDGDGSDHGAFMKSYCDGLGANGSYGVVLVHGFGGGVFSWRHVMDPLAKQVGCSVAAFDRPGWGLTSRPHKAEWEVKQQPNPYKLDSQVDLLLSFCLEMGFSSVVIVGHDDGGLLALKAAERARSFPDSVQVEIRGVILLSVSLSREVVSAFARILLHTSLGKKHAVGRLLRMEITQVINRRSWYNAAKLTAEVLNLYKAPLCIEGWDQAVGEIGRLSSANTLSPAQADLLLKAVDDIPVLVVMGAEDAHVPLKSAQVLASKLANSTLVAISGCGHLPHEECPKALLGALTPFVSTTLFSSHHHHNNHNLT